MVCDPEYKMQFYPGKDATLQEGTKLAKPVNNGRGDARSDFRTLP